MNGPRTTVTITDTLDGGEAHSDTTTVVTIELWPQVIDDDDLDHYEVRAYVDGKRVDDYDEHLTYDADDAYAHDMWEDAAWIALRVLKEKHG